MIAVVLIGPIGPEKIFTSSSIEKVLQSELNNCRHVHGIMKIGGKEPSVRRVVEDDTNEVVGYFVEYGTLKFELRKLRLVELD